MESMDTQKTVSAPDRPDKISFPTFSSPFEHIALAFSGGGFRAASFALGVLSYLESIEFHDHLESDQKTSLLRKVTYLSSASGGTITASLYALHCSENGNDFQKFYTTLLNALREDDLLLKTLEILNDSNPWKRRPQKKRNLINSFAMAYDKYLFSGKTIADLQPKPGVNTHLEEVCFNATEMYRGIVFRQQVKLKSDGEKWQGFLYGNYILNLDYEKAAQLKLGDVLAASSCFPAGFEPILFPDDFMYDDKNAEDFSRSLKIKLQAGDKDELEFLCGEGQSLEELRHNRDILLKKKEGELKFKSPLRVGLMDGGITDNQGLESLMYANQRRMKKDSGFKPFDLMLICDVGSHFMDAYKVPSEKKGTILTKRNLTFYRILLFIMMMGGGFLIYFYFNSRPLLVITGTLLATIGVSGSLVLLGIRAKLTKTPSDKSSGFNLAGNFSRKIINTLLKFLGGTPFRVLSQMVRERLSSVITLNNDVFLKRIRFLLYDAFYKIPDWRIWGKANHVYDLSFTNNLNRLSRPGKENLEPSPAIQKIAEHAFTMSTTLWFEDQDSEKNHRLACLIACGHFTTCFNFLEYICVLKEHKVWNTLEQGFRNRVDQIERKLLDDYSTFKTDPFFLYNILGKDNGMKAVRVNDIPDPKNFEGL